MITLLAAAALATSPGGFRLSPGVPTDMVAVRHVWIEHPGQDFHIHQSTVRLQTAPHPFGLDFELPFVAGWGGGWSDVGLGQWRLGARYWMGTKLPWSLGVEVALPSPKAAWVQVWGSLARDTQPGVEMVVVAEGAVAPRTPFTWRLAAGWRQGPWFGSEFVPFPVVEGAFAWVAPVRGRFSAGIELEVITDLSPVSARPLVRVDLPKHWSVDAVLQLPIGLIGYGDPSVQIGLQVRHFFTRREPDSAPASQERQ